MAWLLLLWFGGSNPALPVAIYTSEKACHVVAQKTATSQLVIADCLALRKDPWGITEEDARGSGHRFWPEEKP